MSEQGGYRLLVDGETIREGDEVDGRTNTTYQDLYWVPATNVGEPAPDLSTRMYRRPLKYPFTPKEPT